MRRSEIRDVILDTALRLFKQRGYQATGVDLIVEETGLAKTTLYRHFASKDDLLYEIYHRLLSRQTERLNAIADSPGPAAERVRAAAADVVESTLDSIEEAIVSFRSVHMLPNPQRAQVRAERRRYHERFRALVEEGQQDGAFRKDVPADLAVHFFFGSVNQLGTWYHREGGLTRQQIAEHYADLFLASLRAE